MISFELGVDDLADTRFALSPLSEVMLSLRVLQDPGLSALHLPWRRAVLAQLRVREQPRGPVEPLDTALLMALVARRRTLPDFLTPRPATFAPAVDDELARVRATPPDVVLRDLVAAHAPDPLPEPLRALAADGGHDAVARLRDAVCALLRQYWDVALAPHWPRMRLLLEADMTYRARQSAKGGARLLFADVHPNLRWSDGVLHVSGVRGAYRSAAAGRGLLLVPSVFAHKPAPPVGPDEPPLLFYPSRGVGTLWTAADGGPPGAGAAPSEALVALIGPPRARLLALLEEPLPTAELARRLRVTPSAVSQHLRVLYGSGLANRVRDGRSVLYRRSALGDRLLDGPGR
ncbi:helix-turn-helix domain-containing protein [Streptomyces sp. NPDC048057]|uniref:helix-turn-helix domain-containing protein n=1 Tax=Streptomyces sp. NPDC048057 TaxID=3155628 RepID=UPI0033C2E978